MEKFSLNGTWQLEVPGMALVQGTVPGSVYSILLENGKMEDPFYGENELDALELMKNDFVFEKRFTVPEEILHCPQALLRCEGLDTVCRLFLNGRPAGEAFNFYRTWEYDVTELLTEGENVLRVEIESPVNYIHQKDDEKHYGASTDAMRGFSYLRKPHCMFGWDWGPRLPDAGIWKDICLLGVNSSRLLQLNLRQEHTVHGTLTPETEENVSVKVFAEVTQTGNAEVRITMTAPDGSVQTLENGCWNPVDKVHLWWPNGLGGQPLYTVKAELVENGRVVDCQEKRIGLRTMTVVRRKDEWGETFAQCVNGQTFFAMGADYIPEDNIFSRITPSRTRDLLEQARDSHFNAIRVWGGGYYPKDDFYDSCDELGLVVWQDFMFACAHYPLTYEFEENITEEFAQNIDRLKHHASLGLWCGNNEMEMFALYKEFEGTVFDQANYIRIFEHIIPHVLREHDPDTFYWPASPSSGGSFDDPNGENRGDVHYWDVWHGSKPFTEYRKFHFRYASEFGFQSFPSPKTVAAFCPPEERNIFSRTMEMHQRNGEANGKIVNYLSKTYLYPGSFEALLYASQLLQADAIRYGVEHWRRNRNDDRCMGAIVWQLNDIWPVASWASIDYYGRWKALQYSEKRFFAPVMISCEEESELTSRRSVVQEPEGTVPATARLNVTNETWKPVTGIVKWSLRDAGSQVLCEGSREITVGAFSSEWAEQLDFTGTDFRENHLVYSFEVDGKTVSEGTVLFTAPKHYNFRDPKLTCSVEGSRITVTAENYARYVAIESEDSDLILSDNYFDMEAGSTTVEVLKGDPNGALKLMSVYDIR